MKNIEIIQAINAIGSIKSSDRVLPVRFSYALNKNFNALKEIYKAYDEEREKNREGYENKTDEEKQAADRALEELLNIDNPDISIHKVKLSDIENCDNLTVNEMEALSFMIEEE